MAPKADETKTSSSSSKGEKTPHYQLSSSDKPGDQLVPHFLKGTNYSTWRRAMTNALTSKHKMVYMNAHTNGCTGCTCGVTVKEKEEKLHQLLTGLNDAYGVVRSNLLCKDPLPSLSNAYSVLTSKEVTIGKPFMESVAFKVNTDGHKGRDQNKKLRCYPPNWQGKKKGKFAAYATILGTEENEASKGQTSQLTQEQIDQLMALLAREKHSGPTINFIGKDLTTKRVIAAGELKGNLYYLDKGTKSKVNATSSSMTELLHQRLGHIPLRRLKFVSDDVNVGDNKESPLGILPQNEIQVDEDLNDTGVEEEEQDVERIINDDEVAGTNEEQKEQVNNEIQNDDKKYQG
ncbi:Gag-polypeptide of LTR copia-type [Sesbania bispinosa]|nr:Gag-polypeptide of LTR copia-type [Sesbania bispinosa]